MLVLFLFGAPSTYAQSDARNGRDASEQLQAQQERGVLPSLLRLLERARDARTEPPRVHEQRGDEEAPGEAPTKEGASPTEASAIPASSSTQEDVSSTTESSSLPARPVPVVAWGATTTPLLTTHTGGGGAVYEHEWPLTEAERGALLLTSLTLVLAGFFLVARKTAEEFLVSLLSSSAPQLPHKQTALS